MKKKIDSLQKIAEELLGLMLVDGKIVTSFDKENDAYVVNVEASDKTGLLIGKKGDTLSSIQMVLGILFKQRVGEWNRVVVNVGDYRQKEEDYLKNLALSAANRAKETGEAQNLYNLKPWQRRVIHLALSDDKDIETESQGEGEERFLVVKAKK